MGRIKAYYDYNFQNSLIQFHFLKCMNNFHNFEKVQESDTEADLAIPLK